jgi:hypothetical protein
MKLDRAAGFSVACARYPVRILIETPTVLTQGLRVPANDATTASVCILTNSLFTIQSFGAVLYSLVTDNGSYK